MVEETASQMKGEKNYFESICYVKHAKNFTYFNLFDFHDSPMRSLLFFFCFASESQIRFCDSPAVARLENAVLR